jgi:ubiquitin-conjugating enzyme E2 M
MKTIFANPDDILNFSLTIEPDEGPSTNLRLSINAETDLRVGMYKGGSFVFSFVVSNEYPHHPPKVRCTQRVPYTVRNPTSNGQDLPSEY